MTPEEERARANNAKRLLDDPLMIEAWTTVERALQDKFKSGGLTDEDLKRLWLSMQMLNKVKGWLAAVVETGKMAEVTLALDKERQ